MYAALPGGIACQQTKIKMNECLQLTSVTRERLHRQKSADFGNHDIPGRLTFLQGVIPPFQGDEPSVGNGSGEATPLLERYSGVIATMQYQGGSLHLRKQIND